MKSLKFKSGFEEPNAKEEDTFVDRNGLLRAKFELSGFLKTNWLTQTDVSFLFLFSKKDSSSLSSSAIKAFKERILFFKLSYLFIFILNL